MRDAELTPLFAENQKLRTENARLRSLLPKDIPAKVFVIRFRDVETGASHGFLAGDSNTSITQEFGLARKWNTPADAAIYCEDRVKPNPDWAAKGMIPEAMEIVTAGPRTEEVGNQVNE